MTPITSAIGSHSATGGKGGNGGGNSAAKPSKSMLDSSNRLPEGAPIPPTKKMQATASMFGARPIKKDSTIVPMPEDGGGNKDKGKIPYGRLAVGALAVGAAAFTAGNIFRGTGSGSGGSGLITLGRSSREVGGDPAIPTGSSEPSASSWWPASTAMPPTTQTQADLDRGWGWLEQAGATGEGNTAKHRDKRVAAGDLVDYRADSHTSFVRVRTANGKGTCTGTVVGDNKVLTAVHCATNEHERCVKQDE